MLEIPEYFEGLVDDFSRTPPFDIDDKTHSTRVVLKLRVVESLLLGNQRLFHALNLFDNGLKQIWPPTQLVDGPQGNLIEPSTTTLRLYDGVDRQTVITW